MQPIDRVTQMLSRCGESDGVLPPTALYNEGWMLRLVLDWAAHHPQNLPVLSFEEGSTWYSEALLPSRFKPRWRGDSAGEGPTHADGVIGHFQPNTEGHGYLQLWQEATQLTVVEAKMASGLSAGTKHAPKFNQAARIVASIAHLISGAKIKPSASTKLGFVLLAPEKRISQGVFAAMMDKAAICSAVAHKAEGYDEEATEWAKSYFEPVADACLVSVLSWESVLSEISAVEPGTAGQFGKFYDKCSLYNGLH